MKKEDIYVVFDGTSHFIINVNDYIEGDIVGRFCNIDNAQAYADKLNDQCMVS